MTAAIEAVDSTRLRSAEADHHTMVGDTPCAHVLDLLRSWAEDIGHIIRELRLL
jgi:hypothetical protein